jgi:hypothetical protein
MLLRKEAPGNDDRVHSTRRIPGHRVKSGLRAGQEWGWSALKSIFPLGLGFINGTGTRKLFWKG